MVGSRLVGWFVVCLVEIYEIYDSNGADYLVHQVIKFCNLNFYFLIFFDILILFVLMERKHNC